MPTLDSSHELALEQRAAEINGLAHCPKWFGAADTWKISQRNWFFKACIVVDQHHAVGFSPGNIEPSEFHLEFSCGLSQKRHCSSRVLQARRSGQRGGGYKFDLECRISCAPALVLW